METGLEGVRQSLASREGESKGGRLGGGGTGQGCVCVCVRGVCVCVHMVCTFAGACASGGACVQTDTHAEALSLTLCQGKS